MREAAFEIARQRSEYQPSLLSQIFAGIVGAYLRRRAQRATYRHLVDLDDNILKDVGITRHDLATLERGGDMSDPRLVSRMADKWQVKA